MDAARKSSRWGHRSATATACGRASCAIWGRCDASLIRANVSWESLVERHVVEVLDENNIEVEKQDRQSGKYKKVCVTDPDATMATNARNRHHALASTRLLYEP